jgi:hypothetical protein
MTTWAQYVENLNIDDDLLHLLMGKNDNVSISCWITILLSFIVFVHNNSCHHRFSMISANRVCVDIMCFANIVKSATYLRCSFDGCSQDDVVIFYTILHCIGLAIFQIVDNYWTFYIYQMVSLTPPSLIFRCLVLMYSPLMYTWFIYDIVFPGFLVLDLAGWFFSNIVLYGFFYFSYLIFFLYLTTIELQMMLNNLNISSETYSTLCLNSYKIIVYNTANILLNLCWMLLILVSSDAYTLGDMWWSSCLLVYQHLAFNTRLLDYAIYSTIDYIHHRRAIYVFNPRTADSSFSMKTNHNPALHDDENYNSTRGERDRSQL